MFRVTLRVACRPPSVDMGDLCALTNGFVVYFGISKYMLNLRISREQLCIRHACMCPSNEGASELGGPTLFSKYTQPSRVERFARGVDIQQQAIYADTDLLVFRRPPSFSLRALVTRRPPLSSLQGVSRNRQEQHKEIKSTHSLLCNL